MLRILIPRINLPVVPKPKNAQRLPATSRSADTLFHDTFHGIRYIRARDVEIVVAAVVVDLRLETSPVDGMLEGELAHVFGNGRCGKGLEVGCEGCEESGIRVVCDIALAQADWVGAGGLEGYWGANCKGQQGGQGKN
jgi:hypothetical protein